MNFELGHFFLEEEIIKQNPMIFKEQIQFRERFLIRPKLVSGALSGISDKDMRYLIPFLTSEAAPAS